MAFDDRKSQEKPDTNVSWLVLGCPSTNIRNLDVTVKPRRNIDEIDLQGLVFDYSHVIGECILLNRFRDKAIQSQASRECVYDGQLKKKLAVARIQRWLQRKIATNFVFYFSGHGSKHGIGFYDAVLRYDELATMIATNTFKKPDHIKGATARKYTDPLITIIIDSCHSGGIVDAFKRVFKKHQDRHVRFQLFFSSQTEELSHEEGNPKRGSFSNKLFDDDHREKWLRYFHGDLYALGPMPFDLTDDQHCGSYESDPAKRYKK